MRIFVPRRQWDAGEDDRPFRLWDRDLVLCLQSLVCHVWNYMSHLWEHCPCAFHWNHFHFPLNVGFVSFLTLGNWSSFHNISSDSEVSISLHLITMKSLRSFEFLIVRCSIVSSNFLIMQDHQSEVEQMNSVILTCINPSRIACRGISLTVNSAWSHLTSKSWTSSLCKTHSEQSWESLYCFISTACTEILVDHVRNLSSS